MTTKRLSMALLALMAALGGCGEKPAPQQQAAAPQAPAAAPAAQPPMQAAPAMPAAPAMQAATPPAHPAMPGQANPHAVAPAAPAPVLTSAPDASGKVTATFMGVETKLPATWKVMQPSNTMRLAQFTVPAASGADGGEVVVFYFPAGKGGTQEENIGRWTSQFTGADGKPVKPAIKKIEQGPLAVTLVELNGSYSRGVGMGQEGAAKPNQTLLAAIVMTPDKRNVTFHLYGPKATVAAQRKAWDEMLKSLKITG